MPSTVHFQNLAHTSYEIHSDTCSRQMASITVAWRSGGLSEFNLCLALKLSVFTEVCLTKIVNLILTSGKVMLGQQIEQC